MIRIAAAAMAAALFAFVAAPRPAAAATFQIDANVGLSALVALGDAHIRTMADSLETLAATQTARSGDWSAIAPPLRDATKNNVPAVLWYAHADGTYWTASSGLQTAKLSDRAYFKRVLAGNTDLGELVTSRSTGRAVAVVAVPVKDAGGTVTGVLGASIYLDDFSNLLAKELGIGPPLLFWAVDGSGTIALHGDTSSIFMKPAEMSPALKAVMTEMLANDEGTATYEFRGKTRTVIYRKSGYTGWRYGFGVVRP